MNRKFHTVAGFLVRGARKPGAMRLWRQVLWMLACLACGGRAARAAANYEPYAFTHFAGAVGGMGYTDGTGSAARFSGPSGVAVHSSGHVYVADLGNNVIRKITPGGEVSTFAGQEGMEGSDDGTGSAARFNSPASVAVDAAGYIYVADTGNHTIRKITPGGVVTTLAGARNAGTDDGTGSAARFFGPYGVAVDSSGYVYVSDKHNHAIRKGWRVPLRANIAEDGSGGFFVRVQGAVNLSYKLQRAQTLDGPWTTGAPQAAPASGLVEFHDIPAQPDHGFYRVVQE